MLTEHAYDSVVFTVLLNIITICEFIVQFLNGTLYEILISITAFIDIYAYYAYLNTVSPGSHPFRAILFTLRVLARKIC